MGHGWAGTVKELACTFHSVSPCVFPLLNFLLAPSCGPVLFLLAKVPFNGTNVLQRCTRGCFGQWFPLRCVVTCLPRGSPKDRSFAQVFDVTQEKTLEKVEGWVDGRVHFTALMTLRDMPPRTTNATLARSLLFCVCCMTDTRVAKPCEL